jgi:RNA polymerase sigma-70 factor, ECF subfamily
VGVTVGVAKLRPQMEPNALDDAYRQWGGQIYRRCLKLLGDKAAAEDATQEVFVRLMRHAGRLSPGGGYLAWIYRVATNYCLNALRDGARLEVRDPEQLPDVGSDAVSGSFAARELTTRILRRFDEETRTIAVLSLVDGMSRDEVAEVMNLSRKTVGKKLARFIASSQRFLLAAEVVG